MSEDCSLSFSVHGCCLAAECLDAKIWEEAFNILTTTALQVPLQSCSTMEQYVMYLLTQCGTFGSWSSWSWGRVGSWWMERPKTDEGLSGTSCWQRHHSAVVPGWSWQFSPLQEPQEHVTRMSCCCWGPRIGKIILFDTEFAQGNAVVVKLWFWIYRGGEWRKSLVERSRSLLEEKLPDLYGVCTLSFQWAVHQCDQVAGCQMRSLRKSQTRKKATSLRTYGDLSQDGNVAKAKSLSAVHGLHKTVLPRNRHAEWWWNCTGLQRNCRLPGFVQVVS